MAKTSPQMTRANPLVYLAPMSGVSDAPFRAAVRAFGVGTLVSEMVASRAMMESLRDRRKLREVFDCHRPTILQLAGTDPALMARAVAIAQDQGVAAIDLNFGCPARKVTGRAAGSALMQFPDLCREIFAAVGRAALVPWSVKMRLGWDETCLNAPDLAALAQAQGASLLTIHGRTRCQFYKGQADWAAVGQVVARVRLPVIVNGDIVDGASAAAALAQSGAAGYMVGRAAIGLPWGLRLIESARRGTPWAPTLDVQAAAQARLLDDMLRFYGVELGLKAYRKHLSAWVQSLGLPAARRRELLTCEQVAGVTGFIDTLAPGPWAAAA